MTAARDEILSRIRAANRAGPHPHQHPSGSMAPTIPPERADGASDPIPRRYLTAHHEGDIVALFAERAADYRAVVTRVAVGDVAGTLASTVRAGGRYAVPAGLPAAWLPTTFDAIRDDPPLSAAELDQLDGAITGCAVAIAETGTVILSHGPAEGRRALTLVPDFHLVVVEAGQIAADLPDALARLDPARPHTLISGPSATSDIELIRVEGVHGPRTLRVVIAG